MFHGPIRGPDRGVTAENRKKLKDLRWIWIKSVRFALNAMIKLKAVKNNISPIPAELN